MEKLKVGRANKMLGMLFDEWKHHTNEDRPLNIKWNIMHMYSSQQLSKLYAIKHHLDLELCALIAILHDIAVVEGKFRLDHDKLAKAYVEGAINRFNDKYQSREIKITKEETNLIVTAIIEHSSKATYSSNPYIEMLKDIDSLDRYLYGIETDGAYEDRVNKMLKELL